MVDTEANIRDEDGRQYQTFRLGYAIHLLWQNGKWYDSPVELHSVEDFWDMLDKYSPEKKKLYVFAHNMAYDYTILMLDSYISSRHLEIKMRVIDSVFMISAGNICFLSSTNYYKQSLKELGKIFGLEKMESPDFKSVSDSELMPYCIRDTQVLSQIIKQHIGFIVSNDLGSFKPTIAGQAFGAFRHRFMNEKMLVHAYSDILELEKLSYRGGRCEVFRMGKFDDITCLDINSMYPYVMKSFVYPISLVRKSFSYDYNKTVENIQVDVPQDRIESVIKDGYFVMADCLLDLKLPVIACKREKLVFPVGKIRQTLTSPEIEYIISNPECGKILSFDKAVYYHQAKIFSEYVDFFYGLRQSSTNEATRQMCKIMLNSLYGKLGQHQSSFPKLVDDEKVRSMYFEIMKENETFEVFTDLSAKYIKIGNDLYFIEKSDNDFARDSIPIIASTVTSYARMMLWELIQKAGKDNILYCDTDSLFVNDAGLANLQNEISPTELGKLKVEKVGSCDIRGAKDYTFNGDIKLKGVKRDAIKIDDSHYRQMQFQTKNIRYRNGTKDGIVILEPITKTISRNYDKGVIGPTGSVSPLILSDR